jgi:hypothetical protein
MKYVRLTQRDIIQPDDEYYQFGGWWKIESQFVGKQKGSVFGWYFKMRRPVT